MKFRGPGSSLRPAREQARIQARRTARTQRGSGAPGGSSSGPVRVHAAAADGPGARAAGSPADEWQLTVDGRGRLVATHQPTGVSTVLATPTPEQVEEQSDGR